MATAAAPPRARKQSIWWIVSFADYVQELHKTAQGKGPHAPLQAKLFNGLFLDLKAAREAITALSDSKVLAEVVLEFEVPTARADSLPQRFNLEMAQKLVQACVDVEVAQELTSQERDGTHESPFKICVHTVGGEAELPKLLAALKAKVCNRKGGWGGGGKRKS